MAVQIVDDLLISNFVDDNQVCGFVDDNLNFLICDASGGTPPPPPPLMPQACMSIAMMIASSLLPLFV
jgi:hypothetical protein